MDGNKGALQIWMPRGCILSIGMTEANLSRFIEEDGQFVLIIEGEEC